MTSDRSRAAETKMQGLFASHPSTLCSSIVLEALGINFGKNERMIQFQGRLFQSANKEINVLRLHI